MVRKILKLKHILTDVCATVLIPVYDVDKDRGDDQTFVIKINIK